MGKEKDPAEGLESDISEITDPKEREAEQLKYYGGDPIEDDDDLTALDRGDNLGEETANEDRGDDLEPKEEPDGDEEGEESDEADGGESETEDADDSDDEAEADADSESSEDSDEELEDDEVDDEEEEEEEPEQKPQGIPRQRFNEVNERMKRAEQELAELKAQQQASEEAQKEAYDFNANEKEYMDLLLDGKTDEALAKRNEIRAAEQELFKTEAKTETVAEVDEQAELRELNSLSQQAEEMFPEFNPESDSFRPELAGKAITYMKGYMADGMKPADAFVEGLADVVEQAGLQQPGEEAPEEKPPAPKKKVKAPIKKVKEKVAAAKKAPTPAAKGSAPSDEAGLGRPDIEQMSDDELDALPAKTLARLRGDYVEE